MGDYIRTRILVPLEKLVKKMGLKESLQPLMLVQVVHKVDVECHLEQMWDKVRIIHCIVPDRVLEMASNCNGVWTFQFVGAWAMQYNKVCHILESDLSTAIDTIKQRKLMDIIKPLVDEDIWKLIYLLIMYMYTTVQLKVRKELSEPFILDMHVVSPQGDGLRPLLFAVYLEACLHEEPTPTWPSRRLRVLTEVTLSGLIPLL